MSKSLVIVKEITICLVLGIIAAGIDTFLFKDVYFKSIDIPPANSYSAINKSSYKVVGDIQDAQNDTQTYEASSSQIDDYLTEYRYTPGTVNPFESQSSVTDLPTETVKGKSSSNTSSNTEELAQMLTEELAQVMGEGFLQMLEEGSEQTLNEAQQATKKTNE